MSAKRDLLFIDTRSRQDQALAWTFLRHHMGDEGLATFSHLVVLRAARHDPLEGSTVIQAASRLVLRIQSELN